MSSLVTKFPGIHLTSELFFSQKISTITLPSSSLYLIKSIRELYIPTGETINLIYSPVAESSCDSCFRPASAIFNKNGHLIITADTTNEIFRVAYNTTLPTIENVYD